MALRPWLRIHPLGTGDAVEASVYGRADAAAGMGEAMSIDVMKQALEVLESVVAAHGYNSGTPINAITALRAAIEQAQKPVAWVGPSWLHPETRGWANDSFESIQIEGWIPLYTAPRQWQGLTEDDVKAPIQRAMQYFGYDPTQYSLGGAATIGFLGLVREIEAKLKEKNT